MSQIDTSSTSKPLQTQLLTPDGPGCLVIKATLSPIAGVERFQPAGFPEIGHVIYDAPKRNAKDGEPSVEKICIVDSPASMANHLETVCLVGSGDLSLHADLQGLPYVVCVTDPATGEVSFSAERANYRSVVSTLTEGHRLASDYFLDGRRVAKGRPDDRPLREVLREGFQIVEVKKDKTYFITTEAWWEVFRTIFQFDPNSLVHGLMFAKEQIKISRLLTAHMEAVGTRHVRRSGVKFDRLGKTTSGQPIFSVSEETASEIRATFILDLALLRSFGRGQSGLNDAQKRLLLDLSLWKIKQLLARPFRYRTQCHLKCDAVTLSTESQEDFASELPAIAMGDSIKACKFAADPITRVYYPAADLFKAGKDEADEASSSGDEEEGGEDEEQ